MKTISQKPKTVDACIDTGGALCLLLPVSMAGSVYAMERMRPGTKFLGCYLVSELETEAYVREMLSRGLTVRIDGETIFN